MSVVLFANNVVGWRVAELLQPELAAVVVHPAERERHSREIVAASGLPRERVFSGAELANPDVHSALAALSPTIGVSALFGYLLRPATLALFPAGCVNLHPSLLPRNRGAHPNVWSIVEGGPAGVSLHYVDAGVDTGDIIAQREVMMEPTDTGETLYHRLEAACVALFMDAWPAVRAGSAPRTPQPAAGATSHRARDLERVDEIDLDRSYRARELIDILRARTFPPYPGAWFAVKGRKVHMRLSLEYAAEDESLPEKPS